MSTEIVKSESQELESRQQLDVGSVIQQVLKAAADPNVDAAKAQTMMNMVLQLQDRQANTLFYEALARVQTKMPRISPNGQILNKDGTVRSKFAKYEDIDLWLRPILADEGLAVSFDGGEFVNGKLLQTMEVSHCAGHKEYRKTTMPMADMPGSSDPQKMGGTISYAKRYALIQFFNIITEGLDNDAQGHENDPLTAEQVGRINDLIIGSQANKEKFLGFLKVKSIENITQGQFEYAANALRRKKK